MVKNPPAMQVGIRDAGLILGSGKSPGGRHGNPPQYSCLKNPMVRGTWQTTVHRVRESLTRLKRLRTAQHTQPSTVILTLVNSLQVTGHHIWLAVTWELYLFCGILSARSRNRESWLEYLKEYDSVGIELRNIIQNQ